MSVIPSAPLIFCDLPTDLIRDIFELAALSDVPTARALTLVSSPVRHWTVPILYHTVILCSSRALRAFLSAISSKPADFPRTRIKHLGIFALGPVQSIDRVLRACAGVCSLACGFSLPGYKKLHGCDAVQALVRPREQHFLGMSCRDGWDLSLIAPSVTHLRIHLTSFDSSRPDLPFTFAASDGEQSGWECLAALSSLTHLAIVYRPSRESTVPAAIIPHLQRLLTNTASAGGDANSIPTLKLILIQLLGTANDASLAGNAVNVLNSAAATTGGTALRIVAEPAPVSAVRQWEQAVRGGPGVWEAAEAVVIARLAAATC
ncbi:hypothetical protein A0H81_12835 [Grifola frondosa]|uniref:F-box domain-containing protein n=1 Tax=Grifola frondosa TaxID=5627 RepID=A0A1C7LT52_GRIFR|nr:hypothetical protein A0H81_12835 [Grifola frondosa]